MDKISRRKMLQYAGVAVLAAPLLASGHERLPDGRLLGFSGPTPTNPLYWLQGDAAYTDAGVTLATTLGQSVQQMSDLSGNGNNFTNTGATKPTFTPNALNGHAAVTATSASSQVLTSAISTVPTVLTIIGRTRDVVANSHQSWMGIKALAHPISFDTFYVNSSADGTNCYCGASLIDVTGGVHSAFQGRSWGGEWYIQQHIWDGTTLQTLINGVVTASVTPGTLNASAGPTAIFADYYNAALEAFSDTDLLELIVHGSVLSGTEMAQLYAYCVNRYWPAVAPAAFNFVNYSAADSNASNSRKLYLRFFTSPDGTTLTEYPISAVSPTIGTTAQYTNGLCRDPSSAINIGPWWYIACSDTTMQRLSAHSVTTPWVNIYRSDRMNGPYGFYYKLDVSALATGSNPFAWNPYFYYDKTHKVLYVMFTFVPQGGELDSNQFLAYIQATDSTLLNWGTPTAISGSKTENPSGDGYVYDDGSGTYYLFFVGDITMSENIKIISATSPTGPYNTTVNALPLGAGQSGKNNAPSVRLNLSGLPRLYIGGFGQATPGYYYSDASSINLATATWATPTLLSESPQLIDGQAFLLGDNPLFASSGGSGGLTTLGIG